MACELTVRLKDEEKTLSIKHLIYETIVCDEQDEIVAKCIDESIKQFGGTPTDVRVTITLEIL